jgi:hypothetical protein
MAFLDPAQARLVRRSINGPARIRGAAGTGKTVVGLDRRPRTSRAQPAAECCSRRTSAPCRRSSSRSSNASRPTWSVASAHGRPRVRVSSPAGTRHRVPRFWMRGPARVRRRADALRASSRLRSSRFSRSYWEDEISHVIKGRCLTRFDEYADTGSNQAQARAPAGDSPSSLGFVRGVGARSARATCARPEGHRPTRTRYGRPGAARSAAAQARSRVGRAGIRALLGVGSARLK